MSKSFNAKVWQTLSAINVNEHTAKKGQLTYLAWTWAWATLMDHYADSDYSFRDDMVHADGSVEVWVDLTVSDGTSSTTRSMWLAVMDHRNKAIINPDARQIADTRMRCLTKAIAMFGLGHYIYAGESIPSAEAEAAAKGITAAQKKELMQLIAATGTDEAKFNAAYKISSLDDLPAGSYQHAEQTLQRKLALMTEVS